MSSLHRISQATQPKRGEVIFIHGLGGHAFETWADNRAGGRQDSWPFWLAEDLKSIEFLTLEYEASPSEWFGRSMPLYDRSKNVLALLEGEGVGQFPLVFVTHSLGGLLAKQILRDALDKGIDSWSQIARRTKGIVYLSTPHSGSGLATFMNKLGFIMRASPAAADLQRNDASLRDLNLWYRNNSRRFGIDTLCFYEKYPTNNVLVVDEASADPGITGIVPIPTDDNHVSISKPPNRESLIYKQVRRFIEKQLGNPAQRLLAITIDQVYNFSVVEGLTKTTYTEAGKINGTTVFGRGQRIRLSIRNLTGEPIDVLRMEVELKDVAKDAPLTLRYQKLQMRLLHTRLPIEVINAPLIWSESDIKGTKKEMGEGRIRLSSSGSPDGKDIHQIEVSVEARAPGLWTYRVRAIIEITGQDLPTVNECDVDLAILLRGT
jgi:pimeloyl-ACP methyl ester carboxylesterase